MQEHGQSPCQYIQVHYPYAFLADGTWKTDTDTQRNINKLIYSMGYVFPEF